MGDRGFGLVKLIIILLLVGVIIFLTYKLGAVGFNYHSFKDEMMTLAKFRGGDEEENLKRSLLIKARRLGIDLWEEDIIIEQYPGEKIIIDVYYEKDLILPFYTHKFKFNPVVEEKLR
jgi:hypothetical protein